MQHWSSGFCTMLPIHMNGIMHFAQDVMILTGI